MPLVSIHRREMFTKVRKMFLDARLAEAGCSLSAPLIHGHAMAMAGAPVFIQSRLRLENSGRQPELGLIAAR